MSLYVLALLAAIGLPSEIRVSVADSIERSRASVPKADRPSEELVAAIIEHESRGERSTCRDDRGGSSRGLMQIWHPDSACEVAVDEARFAGDYDPAQNVRTGVRLLAKDHVWHLAHCKHPHDWLSHYAGTGKLANTFARDVRRRASALRKQVKGTHGKH